MYYHNGEVDAVCTIGDIRRANLKEKGSWAKGSVKPGKTGRPFYHEGEDSEKTFQVIVEEGTLCTRRASDWEDVPVLIWNGICVITIPEGKVLYILNDDGSFILASYGKGVRKISGEELDKSQQYDLSEAMVLAYDIAEDRYVPFGVHTPALSGIQSIKYAGPQYSI